VTAGIWASGTLPNSSSVATPPGAPSAVLGIKFNSSTMPPIVVFFVVKIPPVCVSTIGIKSAELGVTFSGSDDIFFSAM
jgi:hypothetical protein